MLICSGVKWKYKRLDITTYNYKLMIKTHFTHKINTHNFIHTTQPLSTKITRGVKC